LLAGVSKQPGKLQLQLAVKLTKLQPIQNLLVLRLMEPESDFKKYEELTGQKA
jgi:hypothetical protein